MMSQDRGYGKIGAFSPLDDGKIERADAGLVEECTATAVELLDWLQVEEKTLLKFQGEELLGILPRKEALAAELDARLRAIGSEALHLDDLPDSKQSMHGGGAEPGVLRESPSEDALVVLKGYLAEIAVINQRNHVFIQCSLSYWEEMLNIFLPTAYGGREGMQREPRNSGAKGLAINKEV